MITNSMQVLYEMNKMLKNPYYDSTPQITESFLTIVSCKMTPVPCLSCKKNFCNTMYFERPMGFCPACWDEFEILMPLASVN